MTAENLVDTGQKINFTFNHKGVFFVTHDMMQDVVTKASMENVL